MKTKYALIISSEPYLADFLVKYLISMKFQCIIADNLNDSEKIINNDKLDIVIISDLVSGGTINNLIKHMREKHINIPIIVLSWTDKEVERIKAIRRPISMSTFRNQINSLMEVNQYGN
jgi:DNA-binding response OmpR family regulator